MERWTIDITDYAKEIFGDIVTEGIIICNNLSDRSGAEMEAVLFYDEVNKLEKKYLGLITDATVMDYLLTFANGKKVDVFCSKKGTFIEEFDHKNLELEVK